MTGSVCRLKHTSLRHQTLHLVTCNNVTLLQRLYRKILARRLVLSQQHLTKAEPEILSDTLVTGMLTRPRATKLRTKP